MTHHRQIGIFAVAALGIGSMIGAGIFSVLGQIAISSGSLTWIAFVITGTVALLSGYSYAKIAAKFPSRGGVTDFFHLAGIKSGRIRRALGVMYLYTAMVAAAVIAKSFGIYLIHLLGIASFPLSIHITESLLTVVCIIILLLGTHIVGKVELLLVSAKITILAFFIVIVSFTLKPSMLSIAHARFHVMSFSQSLGLAFFAYAGFGVMANAAQDLRNSEQNITRAFMLAILVTAVIYIILSLVILGNLTPEELNANPGIALALAAKPILGKFGYFLISLAALLATSSAVLAMLYSLHGSALQMGKIGSLPKFFTKSLLGNTWGFYLLVAIILAMENFMSLSAIANVTSVSFLIVYSVVFWIAWKLRQQIRIHSSIVWVGGICMVGILILFFISLFEAHNWVQIGLIGVFIVSSFALAWKKYNEYDVTQGKITSSLVED